MRLRNDDDDLHVRSEIAGAFLAIILFAIGAMVWWSWIS